MSKVHISSSRIEVSFMCRGAKWDLTGEGARKRAWHMMSHDDHGGPWLPWAYGWESARHTPIITTADCEGAGEMFRISQEKASSFRMSQAYFV
jgi:hypothetical protein